MTDKRRTEDTRTLHWARRLESRELRKALATALEGELHHLASLTLNEVVDAKLVHAWIDDFDVGAVDQKHLIEIILAASGAAGEVVRESKQSAHDLLGPHAAKEIEILLFDTGELSDDAEDFVADLMQQEFTRRLFTEIIFTSIVSFYTKVNPLFGGFAMRAMEDQIKGFIRLFMPMIQTQAAAFAVDNQAALRDLARRMLGESLQRPIGEHFPEPSANRKAAGTALLRQALKSSSLEALSRAAAHAVLDSVYAATAKRSLGELFDLDKRAPRLAARGVEAILPFLTHAPILDLIVNEIEAAHEGAAAPAAKTERTRSPARKRRASPE